LLVLDASAPWLPASLATSTLPLLGVVWTKCDVAAVPPPAVASVPGEAGALARLTSVPVFATSARHGLGLAAVAAFLQGAAARGAVDAGGPLRLALLAARTAVARGVQGTAVGPELVAAELQAALQALDGIAGQHSPEHLLDRIYGRFCLGK
jgi:tRNA U34 5-carboxymethylaminomethyl modifying GTPase MnmE/TrmE